jgi:hypothetical protein
VKGSDVENNEEQELRPKTVKDIRRDSGLTIVGFAEACNIPLGRFKNIMMLIVRPNLRELEAISTVGEWPVNMILARGGMLQVDDEGNQVYVDEEFEVIKTDRGRVMTRGKDGRVLW